MKKKLKTKRTSMLIPVKLLNEIDRTLKKTGQSRNEFIAQSMKDFIVFVKEHGDLWKVTSRLHPINW